MLHTCGSATVAQYIFAEPRTWWEGSIVSHITAESRREDYALAFLMLQVWQRFDPEFIVVTEREPIPPAIVAQSSIWFQEENG